jgi:predicted nucleic acid-binding protein
VHAFNSDSPNHSKASKILREAMRREVEAVLTHQTLYEFYSVMTNPQRVERPLEPTKAAEICMDLWNNPHIGKISQKPTTPNLVFTKSKELGLIGADVFDCVLTMTAVENDVEAIYTENTRDFERFRLLMVENPFI